MSADRLVEPVEALAEARPEVDPERLVLALEPGAADAEDRPAVADVVEGRRRAWRCGPGCGTCSRRPSARAGSGVVSAAQAASVSQPSKIGWRHGPWIASRWSQVQTESQPAASAVDGGVAEARPVGRLRPELGAKTNRLIHRPKA